MKYKIKNMSQEKFRKPELNTQDQIATTPSVLQEGNEIPQNNNETEYEAKVDFITEMLNEKITEKITEKGKFLINLVGGPRKATEIDLWENIKEQQAESSGHEVHNLLFAETDAWLGKKYSEGEVLDNIFISVAEDRFGTTDSCILSTSLRRSPDIVDFCVGDKLDMLVDNEEINDGHKLAKATKAMHLLLAQGIYKLTRWGDRNQLITALRLIEDYTKRVPDFNPKEAGVDEAEENITIIFAAIQVDQKSKPNYLYAQPQRGHLIDTSLTALELLNRIDAHMFLRYEDFNLPQPETDTTTS